jgi:hypothetical protein
MIETLYLQERETGKRGIVVGSCREPVVEAFKSGKWKAESGKGEEELGARSVEDGAWSAERGARSVADGGQKSEVRDQCVSAQLKEDIGPRTLAGDQSSNGPAVSPATDHRSPITDATVQSSVISHQSSVKTQSVLTYGGRDDRGLVAPTDVPQEVKTFNGNLVLVPREAYETLGNLSNAYRQGFGDIDYGIRAQRSEVSMFIAPMYLATCKMNVLTWRNPKKPLLDRIRACFTPKGIVASEVRHFLKMQGRPYWFLSLLKLYLLVIFPKKE